MNNVQTAHHQKRLLNQELNGVLAEKAKFPEERHVCRKFRKLLRKEDGLRQQLSKLG